MLSAEQANGICLKLAQEMLFDPRIFVGRSPKKKPQIVHFCGHGLEDGSLQLEDDGGQDKAVSTEVLASLFKLHMDYVNCVLLNTCHSVKSAEEISKYINYVIGMNQQIQDKSAIKFAEGFYDGLGYETPENQDVFQRAFQEGSVAIKLDNFSQSQIPVIKTKINNNNNEAELKSLKKDSESSVPPPQPEPVTNELSGFSFFQKYKEKKEAVLELYETYKLLIDTQIATGFPLEEKIKRIKDFK